METNSEQQGLLTNAEEGAVMSECFIGSYESTTAGTTRRNVDDVSDSDSDSSLTLNCRYVLATVAVLSVVWTAVLATTSSDTTETNIATELSPFLLGTGLVPPYISKGVPSSPIIDNYFDSDQAPFSLKSPAEVGIDDFIRSADSRPGNVFGTLRRDDAPSYELPKPAMPTNSWYQNLLVGTVNNKQLGAANRVYTIRECNCLALHFVEFVTCKTL